MRPLLSTVILALVKEPAGDGETSANDNVLSDDNGPPPVSPFPVFTFLSRGTLGVSVVPAVPVVEPSVRTMDFPVLL